MADDEKPFSSPFERLQDLKKRLPKARRPPAEPAAAPPPVEQEAPEPEPENPEAAFSSAMREMGVDELEEGTERIQGQRPLPSPSSPARPARQRTVHSGLRGREEGFDDSTPIMDLHGLTVHDAVAEVKRMAAVWRKAGITRARIVTGRGSHSGDGHAAIRDAVERWLRQAPGAVGVYRARPDSGGEGVVLFEQQGKGRKR